MSQKPALIYRQSKFPNQAYTLLFVLSLATLILVPLAFHTSVYEIFASPKFALLLFCASGIFLLLVLSGRNEQTRRRIVEVITGKHTIIVALYVFTVLLSSIFGVVPIASFIGSAYNRLGMITHCCFLICYIGLATSVDNEWRLRLILWAISLTGLIVATYTFLQFFGRDPFFSANLYTAGSPSGSVIRVPSTLGHADYLGNFLLYTTPVSVGLAMTEKGRAQLFHLLAVLLSTVAILFSGTRGAWLGLCVETVLFVVLLWRDKKIQGEQVHRNISFKRVAVMLAILGIFFAAIVWNPASRNLTVRVKAFALEGFNGAGRTLLWHDASKMVPHFALIGCGAEGFRKAFLSYKSKELAQLAPQTNNESSHNAYLDAALSFGLAGVVFYIAIFFSSIRLLIRARRRALTPRLKMAATSLLMAFSGVAIHNFFIFDQISTGLYFFAFAALSFIIFRLTATTPTGVATSSGISVKPSTGLQSLLSMFALALLVAASWFGWRVIKADAAMKRAFAAATIGNVEAVKTSGSQVIAEVGIGGDYNLLFAEALTICDEQAQRRKAQTDTSKENATLDLAIAQAEQSIHNTFTPDASYLLLAYLCLLKGDTDGLRRYATEAIRLDPNYARGRWLMAEALLAAGDWDGAETEATLALELNSHSKEAKSIFKRTRWQSLLRSEPLDTLTAHCQNLIQSGKTLKAEKFLIRQIREASEPCPACHRALAVLYEMSSRYADAIAEWQIFRREAPDEAAREKIALRLEELQQKSPVQSPTK